MTTDTTDVELARIPRRGRVLVILHSRRRLPRGDVRHWITLVFERYGASDARHFTLGTGEFDALEAAVVEVRRQAKEER